MLYELSWSRIHRQMRWIDQQGYETYVGRGAPCIGLRGTCTIKNNSLQGRLLVECDSIQQYFTKPCPDNYGILGITQQIHHVDIPKDSFLLNGTGYWCIDYRRNDNKEEALPGDWRLYDINGNKQITYVNRLLGQFGLDWHDKQSHLFHRGDIYIHTDDNDITTGYLVQFPYLDCHE